MPWTNSLFENAPADALGIRSRWDQEGHDDRKLWVLGGDGAMYDIGFQSLSRMVASGADIKVLVLDTQVYSNTGGQASTATFGGQVTKLSAFGKAQHGKIERRKELGRILMSHGDVYVAQVSTAHVNHFYRAVIDANTYPGPAVLIAYTPCMPEHGIADDAGARSVRAAVDSRAFPLFTYDPRRGPTIADRLDLAGNPARDEDWHRLADGSAYDFLAFARLEGRFAPHFAADGSPSPEIVATNEDRLANWRTLQELAGRGRSPAAATARPPLSFEEHARPMDAAEAMAAAERCLQCPDPTCVAACPLRIDIPQYLEHVAAGDFGSAAEVLFARNPMPGVTGRVCAHERQCEGACKRASIDGVVPIGAIERFVGAYAAANPPAHSPATPSGRTVAVVGAGPAGLACAGRLAAAGDEVTVFDAYGSGGGILRYGIPGYRLPKALVDEEIERLEGLGVRFEWHTTVGVAPTVGDLRDRFDAVFLGVGAGTPILPGIPGEALTGVLTADDYLEGVSRLDDGPPPAEPRNVVVLGGGNVAIDAARSAIRVGAESVTLVYRRDRAAMSASAAEIDQAVAEGVRMVMLAAPVAALGDAAGHVRAVRCVRTALGPADASGRPEPILTDDEFELDADQLIFAISSRPDGWLAESGELATDDRGRLLVRDGLLTSTPGVMAGGDVVRGPATVVEAIADGLRAAEQISGR